MKDLLDIAGEWGGVGAARPRGSASSSFLLLSSLELTDTEVYEPWIRALLGTTASHFCVQEGGGATELLDPEAVLPWVIHTHIPTPLKGIVVTPLSSRNTYNL